MGKRIVIALGGNALGNNLPEQMVAVKHTAKAIVDLIQEGHQVVVAHGNGPQVGMIQNAMTELTRSDHSHPIAPMSVCTAMSQGYIGYDLQNSLREELLNRGIQKPVATVLTQVEVDPADPAFQNPEGYDVMPEVEEIAKKNAAATGGSYKKVSTMEEAFDGADIVYPKSWAPFAAMEQRTKLYQAGDQAGIDALEKQLLAQNAQHKDWTCSEEMMKRTKNGKALYLHCLPADITGLSCPEGEVDNSVFDRYLVPLYKEASYKPYIIAAMIMMSKVKDPVSALMALDQGGKRKLF